MPNKVTDEAVAWFIRLRSADVSSGDYHLHQEWLASSKAHRRVYEAVGREWSGLDGLNDWAGSELSQRNLKGTLAQRRQKNVWAMVVATAATFALAAVLLPRLQETPERYQTAKAEQREVSLADGSRLNLNTASAVEVQFDADVRQLTLTQGEGVFDVEHDSKRPFVVVAGKNKVIALGTRFSVYYLNDQDIQVTVLEGRVAVVPLEQPVQSAVRRFSDKASKGTSQSSPSRPGNVVLEADQQAQVSGDGQFSSLVKVSAASEVAWIEGKLIFDNAPLREVVAELSRYIPGQITVDESVPDHPVTGVIHIRSAETMLELLSQVVPVTPVKQSASLTILHAAAALPNRG